MRALWKPRLVLGVGFSRTLKEKSVQFDVSSTVYGRNFIVPASLVGKRIQVHMGNSSFSALIRTPMVGNYLGRFFFYTKKRGKQIHRIAKKLRKKK